MFVSGNFKDQMIIKGNLIIIYEGAFAVFLNLQVTTADGCQAGTKAGSRSLPELQIIGRTQSGEGIVFAARFLRDLIL
jgi:hypothetical protein